MSVRVEPLIALALGYLLGSIPFGLILTRLVGTQDLRKVGSGNIGATNVLRTGHKGLAAATLLLDAAKGFLAVWLARSFLDGPPALPGDLEAFAGVGAVLGHCFPIWLHFRGGKGVATLMGVTLAFATILGAAFAVVWIGTLALTRISSLSGMAAALSAPIVAFTLGIGPKNQAPALVILAILILWTHRGNIARLLKGEEARVGTRP